MIAYDRLSEVRSPDREFSWSDRDAILYAIAIGAGADPLDPAERQFIYENELKVLPSFATVAAWGANPVLADAQVDYSRVVHAEQGIEIHRPLPASARVRPNGRITDAIDKGDKGAILFAETQLRDAETAELFVTMKLAWFARGDGHFGGPTQSDQPPPHVMPGRPADLSLDFETRPDQAALYRLLGDRNPLHIDPDAAAHAGFDRPILHGLCTFGITCRAVLKAFCGNDPAPMRSHGLRFAAPVFPGETITVDLWRDGDIVSFEARVARRGATVISNGRSEIAT